MNAAIDNTFDTFELVIQSMTETNETFDRISAAIDMVNLTHQATAETFTRIHAAVDFTYATFEQMDSAIEDTERTFNEIESTFDDILATFDSVDASLDKATQSFDMLSVARTNGCPAPCDIDDVESMVLAGISPQAIDDVCTSDHVMACCTSSACYPRFPGYTFPARPAMWNDDWMGEYSVGQSCE